MNDLAIVIPAYKPDYLAASLESLAAQTDRRFTVYVGDDASPHEIGAIVSAYKDRLDLRYVRFDENLGGKDLVAQWTRCVELSEEPWVWLFSDDDLAMPDCVAAFYCFLHSQDADADLLHFQTDIIDSRSHLIRHTRAFPTHLSAYEFALGRLQFHWSSFAAEYIFSRQAWVSCGGFVNFPAAWCADDASWIKLAGSKGIRTLPSGQVQWRQSGRNITADTSLYVTQKTEAMLMYMNWLMAHFQHESPAKREALQQTFHAWFFKLFGMMNPLLGPIGMVRLGIALKEFLNSDPFKVATSLAANEYFAVRTDFKRLLQQLKESIT